MYMTFNLQYILSMIAVIVTHLMLKYYQYYKRVKSRQDNFSSLRHVRICLKYVYKINDYVLIIYKYKLKMKYI